MNKKLLTKLLALVLLLATACDRPSDQLFSLSWRSSRTVDITIEQIAETGQPGQFTLTGTATLPDQTPLTVSAVRRIGPLSDGDLTMETPQYAILDRKSALAKAGRWQVQLMLWEISAEGKYQENWQTIASDEPDMTTVSSSVDFLATVKPIDLAQSGFLAAPKVLDHVDKQLLNFTPDGEPYLKTSQSKTVALPSSAIAAPGLPQEVSDNWADRLSRGGIDGPEIRQIPFMDADNVTLPEQNFLR